MKKIVCMLSSVLLLLFISCTQQYDSENDFRVEIADDGMSVVIIEYIGNNRHVRIPSTFQGLPVTSIGNGAFSGQWIQRVDIPNGVITIGNRAFYSNMLTRITIPDSVTSIGSDAFMRNSIDRITIGANVNIGPRAFGLDDAVFGDRRFRHIYNTQGRIAGTYRRARDGFWVRR